MTPGVGGCAAGGLRCTNPGIAGRFASLWTRSAGGQPAQRPWRPGFRAGRLQHCGCLNFLYPDILVLDGTFEDEHGCYLAGSWLRNPHGSRHTPFSTDGFTIYVKTGTFLAETFTARPEGII